MTQTDDALRCRACAAPGGPDDVACDLGRQPSAALFPVAGEPGPDPVHPLRLWVCPGCGLAQLAEDAPDVVETPGVEPAALREQAADALARVRAWLPGAGTVREFGSPHGGSWLPLLSPLVVTEGAADVVVDSFGLMHESDQADAARRRAAALAENGVLLLTVQELGGIVGQGQTNAIRHGHAAYYSLTALARLLAGAGLAVRHVEHFALYGGTLLVVATRGGEPDDTVTAMLAEEASRGLATVAGVRRLGEAVARNAAGLRSYLADRAADGTPVIGYAAASRAVVDLCAADVDATLLPAVVDASPAKQGRALPLGRPGPRIPIVGPEVLDDVAGEVLLLLPDLAGELLAQRPLLAGRLVWQDPETGRVGGPTRHVRSFAGSVAAQDRLHELVPGGAHTYARGSDQYPEHAPPVLVRGRGALAWDVDGSCYVEYGIGLRAVTLGHAHAGVDAAVARAVRDGVNFSRPTLLEARAAERFLAPLPHHQRVKFAKNGSDVTTAAVKLARAATGRDGVLVGDQSFFSIDDWWIAQTPMDAGIPAAARAGVRRFPHGDVDAVRELLDADGDVACVVLQPASATEPVDGAYLAALRQLCRQRGVVLVFDEIITGCRWHRAGVQGLTGVTPDLACWAKGIGNGYAIAALTGTAELMDLGGLATDAARPFLLSTTYGPESVGLAALLAVADVYDRDDPVAAMRASGERLAAGVADVVADAGLGAFVGTAGYPGCLMFWTKDADGAPSQELRTVFLQGLLAHGVLGQSFVTCAAHTDADVDHTVWAVAQSLPDYARALSDGWHTVLSGRPVAPSNRRFASPRRRGGVS